MTSIEFYEPSAHWFHAVDVPLSEQNKPTTSNTTSPKDPISYQPVPKVKQPANWVPFSKRDANALEQAYRSGTPGTKVPCNEDYLFEVDIDKREIHPVYWSGPIYEVRRGTWFQQADLNKYIPCDENLAMQIEEGYKKHQAWIPSPESDLNSPATSEAPVEKEKERRWALLGKYLSQYVTYTNPTTAWLLNDDMTGRLTKTFFSTITNNENLGGTRLIRDAEQQRDIKQEAVETQDYENEESECEERVIDHLILVVHGIGQKLSERLEWIRFIHDVNTLRKTIKSIVKNNTSETPQNSTMKSGSNTSTSSSRRNSVLSDKCSRSGVQVLPILWREEIKFGMAADDENFQRDLGLPKTVEEGKTTLGEITLDGVPTLRLLISDVLMDVLLYMTPRYREIMINTVTNEANRIYNLFIQRNPKFLEVGGKVSLYGHSLGSVLAFDVLCHQPPIPSSINELSSTSDSKRVDESYVKLDFPVQNFFSAGSPIGLFLLLKGLKIGSRKYYENVDKTSDGDVNLPLSEENNIPLCYPKVRNIYNLFHNADPIAYRLEPLIARHYGSSLKPAMIPYQKGGLKAVHLGIQEFGTEIANKATNIFSTVKTSLMFTRGLQSLMQQNSNTSHKRSSSIPSINTEIDSNDGSALTNYPPTQYAQPPSPATNETVAKEKDDPIGAARLKSLNITGRVDYVLQEGILDVSYINAITAHMCYWADLDAVSFVVREIYREEPEDE
ncbi:DDHD domain-containing protein [Gigaspora rosea]|uniref:DDHD domain-containing protein n=1 Tax=Gigaspora rosea TaxID=44941 RepID=A0A397V8Z4_9GLOM|nr:DDHD domain-containing protein [Gigaspora rosea]